VGIVLYKISAKLKTAQPALLCSTISLFPRNSTNILPLVGYGGSLLVEPRKNGQQVRGVIWWDYVVESSEFYRPPHPARRPARNGI
jgi:hypothetical protein